MLVVDDNRDAAFSLAMLLRLMGSETQTAESGEAALEAFETFKPEVIFMDIGLPKLSGAEACREIRNRTGGNDIFIAALTGWGQEDDRLECEGSRFDERLLKPVDVATLQRVMNSLPQAEQG